MGQCQGATLSIRYYYFWKRGDLVVATDCVSVPVLSQTTYFVLPVDRTSADIGCMTYGSSPSHVCVLDLWGSEVNQFPSVFVEGLYYSPTRSLGLGFRPGRRVSNLRNTTRLLYTEVTSFFCGFEGSQAIPPWEQRVSSTRTTPLP